MVAPALAERPRTHSGIRTLEDVTAAGVAFRRHGRGVSVEHGAGGDVWQFTVTPGSVKLGTKRVDTFETLFGVSRDQILSDNSSMSGDDLDPDEAPTSTRGLITGWSQKSRNRMRYTLSALDYSPLFRQGQTLPKMVTLTLPHEWEKIAPTASVFKQRLVDNGLKRSFRRHWGYEIAGVWKLEFQDRKQCRADGCHDPKAPHLHILMSLPSGADNHYGLDFESWLRKVWADLCRGDNARDSVPYVNHLAKGVHIDDTHGLTGTDSKRIADYFVKHGVFAAKEYQNRAPQLWLGDDPDRPRSTGRYWGYWGLQKAEYLVPLGVSGDPGEGSGYVADPRAADPVSRESPITSASEDGSLPPVEVQLARLLRKVAKSQGRHFKKRVTLRDWVDPDTGEVRDKRVTRTYGPFVRRSAGFLTVNDGVAFAEAMSRALELGVPSRPAPGLSGAVLARDAALAELAARDARYQAYYDVLGMVA